jgi:hypothetical protein
MVEDRGVARDADLLRMVHVSVLFSLARGVSPDLGIVLRARLSDSLLLGPLGGVCAIDLVGGVGADGDRALRGVGCSRGVGDRLRAGPGRAAC